MMVNKLLMQKMLAEIENRFQGKEIWAWKIMKNMDGVDKQLSEYELYGHYIKNKYPESISYRNISWLREGSEVTSFFPNKRNLNYLKKKYYFASFEYRPKNLIEKMFFRIKIILYNFISSTK